MILYFSDGRKKILLDHTLYQLAEYTGASLRALKSSDDYLLQDINGTYLFAIDRDGNAVLLLHNKSSLDKSAEKLFE
jgi:hypothetical protein